MKEIKCPKCGEVFQVDEAGYSSIVKQVRDKEFNKELQERKEFFEKQLASKIELTEKKIINEYQKEINERDIKISNFEKDMKISISDEIAKIQKQHEEELKLKEKELNELNLKIEKEKNDSKNKQTELSNKLKEEYQELLIKKEQEIAKLNSAIENSDLSKQVLINEVESKYKDKINEKEQQILNLKNDLSSEKASTTLQIASLKESFENEIKLKDEAIDYYKDLKIRMSTKMLGETLEQHCNTEFNNIRPLFPGAYFEKDNTVKDGSKGDFIFRDYDDGFEYISIMFEMKNEMDTTSSKHKNEDFFKELDKDRTAKKCEYAILVSLLEPESDLYNSGIVDVSHRYPKMYVIRPQFFIPIISILTNTSKKGLEYKKALEKAKSESIDITNFETELSDFQEKFGRNYRLAKDKFDKAIDDIDKTIDLLNKIKDELTKSGNNLRLANDKAVDLSLKKLAKNSPSILTQIEK